MLSFVLVKTCQQRQVEQRTSNPHPIHPLSLPMRHVSQQQLPAFVLLHTTVLRGGCMQENERSLRSCSSPSGSGEGAGSTAARQQHTLPPLQVPTKRPDWIIFSWTALLLKRLINQKHLPIEITSRLPSDTYHFNNIIYSSIVAV